MAENFEQLSSKSSFDSYNNYFSTFASDNNETEEPEKDSENDNDTDNLIFKIIKSPIESPVSEPEYITLEELADSDIIRNRQLAAKSIVDYLQEAGSNKEALHSVISVMCKLSEDEDMIVRSELIEQIPSIALYCKEHSEDLNVVIRQQIVPYTVKLLTDFQKQIRKIGHTTLLALLENNIIDHSQLSEWICPLIAQLATSDNIPEALKIEDVSVMCKMIPYVGKEMTEKFFLEPFLLICRDSSSSAREVCMLNFGNISQVIGSETTEKFLLSAFLDLCQESWQIKSKCVNIAIDLATSVSSTTRKEILSPIYMSFLKDDSAVISEAAYLSLGRFISTFAEPSITGLNYNNGTWIDTPTEIDSTVDVFQNIQCHQENRFESLTSEIISKPKFLEECSFKNLNVFTNVSDDSHVFSSDAYSYSEILKTNEAFNSYTCAEIRDAVIITNLKNLVENNDSSKYPVETNSQIIESKSNDSLSKTSSKQKQTHFEINQENLFNNFQFWRLPLPEVDIEIEESKPINFEADTDNETSSQLVTDELPVQNSKEPDMLQDTDDSKLNKEDRDSAELHLKSLNVQFTKKKSFDSSYKRRRSYLEKSLAKKCLEDRKHSIWFFREESDNQMKDIRMTDTEKIVYEQDIVPPELLMEYINEITMSKHVMRENLTYYFPSVAYALGRKHWPCIRDLFKTISSLVAFNIRKTVASSLHELAVILGPDITTEDLLPVFLKLIRQFDLTFSLMKNISQFLKIIKPHARRQFLPLIEEICAWNEDPRSWRYRLIVAEQFISSVELFSSHEALHFLPASLQLMQDKVAAVRRSGAELLAVIVKSIMGNPKSSKFLKATLYALDEKYRRSNKWLWRQFYVFICQELAAKNSLPTEFYVEEIVLNLFSLAWDAVPNVRLAVARCLALTLFPLDFLPSIQKRHFKLLLQVMYSLQSDVDRDVRHFAHLSAAASNIFKTENLSTEDEESSWIADKLEK